MVAGGGMLMPTAFEPISIVSVWKNVWGGGYNAARGLISRDIAVLSIIDRSRILRKNLIQ